MDSAALRDHLEQLFADCDVDRNGSLGRDEFIKLCSKIGLNKEEAIKTFDRLDTDKNDRITFDEFAAGFDQYAQTSANSSQQQQQQQRTKSTSTGDPPSSDRNLPVHHQNESNTSYQPATNSCPVSQSSTPKSSRSPVAQRKPKSTLMPNSAPARGRKSASPLGVMSLGGSTSSSGANSASMRRCTSGSAGYSTDSTDLRVASSNSPEVISSCDNINNNNNNSNYYNNYGSSVNGSNINRESSVSVGPSKNQDPVVVYSSDAIGYDHGANGSGQFASTISSSGSFNQLCNMQDLLDCVQKLQNENQILTQIFFKDKREREEYISQLGEEFDQQLKEVEERANKRAREELENEKKRLREMMKAERETLEHHYQTIEKMSRMIKNPNVRLNEDGETIEKVRSKLEDTFVENRQLKRSLLDTKTDVAMIWKEMEKLKSQYENKLSSAYEKHTETKNECDHIKKQLNLMKDSNRKLQDASDVITNYITDKVEPVIKVASGEIGGADIDLLHGSGHASLDGSNRLAISSQSNSRRGSILSDYLNTGSNDESGGDVESMASTQANFRRTTSANNLEFPTSSSADRQATGGLEPVQFPKDLDSALDGNKTSKPRLNPLMQVASKTKTDDSISDKQQQQQQQKQQQQQYQQQQQQQQSTGGPQSKLNKIDRSAKRVEEVSKEDQEERKDSLSNLEQGSVSKSSQIASSKTSSLKKIGRHLFIGSRTQSEAKVSGGQTETKGNIDASSKSRSVDGINDTFVEPADGPSEATFNIILVGDSFVGKSSFAARFVEGNFVQGLISNCSIDFKTKAFKVDNVNYTVNLWDTAGQERFRSITASYFRKADGIILMYDVTDRRTYMNVRNWMSTIADTATENVAVLLVGNKVDLRTKENKSSCVPTEEGLRLAREYDIVFLETSVKTGTNLVPSLGQLIRLIAKNNAIVEEDSDRIRLNDKSKTFNCMPKNC